MMQQITTRIPLDMAMELAEIAKKERRSVSAQLAILVERYITEVRAQAPAPTRPKKAIA
jgi:hypothetical protein